MKESADVEATAREGAPARESEEPAASLTANAGHPAAGQTSVRKPAVRAKTATATMSPRRNERGQKPADEAPDRQSSADIPELPGEQEAAESVDLESGEVVEDGEADQLTEDSESEQSAPRSEGVARFSQGPVPRVMPRPMAPAETFAEGDYVVYPTHGVGRVEKIATEEIAGHKLELIHITFEENRMTLRVPVAKARTAGLRKLATRHMFDKALDVLRGRARVKRTMWSRRAQEYEAKINSGDPLSIAEVVRDLHRNAGQPDQSFSERQIYKSAMDRLAAELAALDRTDKAAAAVKLAEFLKTVG